MAYHEGVGLGSNDSSVLDWCGVYHVLACSGDCVEYNPRVAEDFDLYADLLDAMEVMRYNCVEDQTQP